MQKKDYMECLSPKVLKVADETCIGKWCMFWDRDEKDDGKESILYKIEGRVFIDWAGEPYSHCRTLTEKEVLKLIRE